MRTGLVVAVLVGVLASRATAQEAPTPAPSTGDPDVTFGSRPDRHVEGALGLFVADWKSRSHFGFGESGSREGEVAFVDDLGLPGTEPMPWLTLRLDAGVLGWLGVEGTGLAFSDETDVLARERQTNGVTLSPGDLVHSHGSLITGRVAYGYEFRVSFSLGPVPLELYASPTLGLTVFDLDVRLRREAPQPTSAFGGHVAAYGLTPGLDAGVEAFDHVRVGVEYVLPAFLALTTTRVTLLDRVRVFLGVHFFGVEATVGWRLVATHAIGGGDAADIRLRGFDFSLGASF
jgi:hypothetical protein